VTETADVAGRALTVRAALLLEPGPEARLRVEEVQLDPPRGTEVRVKLGASGLCYSDEHLRKGDYAFDWSPCLRGHEGAGVVTDVGELVTTVGPGDHVVLSFMPSCGDCPDCVDGRQNLCERGALLFSGVSVYDGTQRFSWRGQGVGQFCLLGTFAEYTVVHERRRASRSTARSRSTRQRWSAAASPPVSGPER
jgi:Zn-dependent alcohol dehydrogenase